MSIGSRTSGTVVRASSGNTAIPSESSSANRKKSRRGLQVAAAVLVLGAIGAGFYLHSRQAVALTAKDTILIAELVNTTGDAVFDGTLKKALAVDLEQSPYLNVLSNQSVATMLKLMGREPDHRVTGEFARELCQRLGSKAMLAGVIANLGDQYLLGLDELCDRRVFGYRTSARQGKGTGTRCIRQGIISGSPEVGRIIKLSRKIRYTGRASNYNFSSSAEGL